MHTLEKLIQEIEQQGETKKMGLSLNLSKIQQNDVNTSYDKSLLPEGFYAAIVKECKVDISKAGHAYFAFTFQMESENGWTQNPFKGRLCWETLMINHPSETVMEISQKAMADILVACGAESNLQIDDVETELPLHVLQKPIYVMLQHRWDKLKLEYRPTITAYWGRGEFEGKNRYAPNVTIPNPDMCINGNQEICDKSIIARDAKLVRATKTAQTVVNKPTEPTKNENTHFTFQDVPF